MVVVSTLDFRPEDQWLRHGFCHCVVSVKVKRVHCTLRPTIIHLFLKVKIKVFTMWRHSGLVVSALEVGSLSLISAVVLFPRRRIFATPCLSPPRCINGYQQHNAGG